ncbi:MAG: hypothetical protein DHS20C02_00530 [Micavibrio sp.]|nr:MAG: hypothetical protein DHS20C02_00530 [Micavibrio sp.]
MTQENNLIEDTVENSAQNDHPSVIMRPPLLYGLFLLAAIIIELVIGIDLIGWGTQFAIGMLLMSLGFGIGAASIMRFAGEGTNVQTNRPATALVTDGTYRFSRNPIYIALTCLYVGLCFLLDLLWGFIFLAPLLYTMNRHVIEREEEYLEKKFGESYQAYKKSTRRWL